MLRRDVPGDEGHIHHLPIVIQDWPRRGGEVAAPVFVSQMLDAPGGNHLGEEGLAGGGHLRGEELVGAPAEELRLVQSIPYLTRLVDGHDPGLAVQQDGDILVGLEQPPDDERALSCQFIGDGFFLTGHGG